MIAGTIKAKIKKHEMHEAVSTFRFFDKPHLDLYQIRKY